MHRFRRVLPTVAFVSVLGATLLYLGDSRASDPEPDKPPSTYRPIPPGFDFPASQAQLLKFANEGDIAGARRHGWHLWAGINQPATDGPQGTRVWQTWFSYAQAFSPKPIPHPRSPRSKLVQQDLRTLNRVHSTGDVGNVTSGIPIYDSKCNFTGLELVNNGDILVAKMIYDWNAYHHIRSKKLWDPDTLNAQVKWGQASRIDPFPREAIVLKHMEWPVAQDRLTALPVWDNAPIKDINAYNGYEYWTRGVAVDGTGKSDKKTADVSYLFGVKQSAGHKHKTKPLGPFRFVDARVVSLDRFYYRRIDAETWNAMNKNDQCIINQAANWAYNRNFEPGDYLVTVACHLITKEIPNWAMQTFWWHDSPNQGPFAENKPKDLKPGPWQQYLQATSYHMELPREYDTSPRVAYNPYIELAAEHPIPTNCQSCHGRAAWAVPDSRPPVTPNYQNRGKVDPKVFRDVLELDFLWSVQQGAQANLPLDD